MALVDQGKPQTAAALVDTIRKDFKDPTLCSAAETAAVSAIKGARDILGTSERSADSLEDPPIEAEMDSWKSIEKDAQEAVALDSENPDASALEKRAAEALDAIEPDDWWTRVLARGTAWKNLAKDDAGSWASLIGAAIGMVGLILLAARMLLLLPLTMRFPPRLRKGTWWGSPETASAVTVTLAAVASALWLPSLLDEGARWRTTLLVGLVLTAVFFTWCWLYHRQRVVIEMLDKGSPSTAGATAVVAHLRRLGASPPRGLEIPLGADAQTLAASNITAGGLAGKFLVLLQTALAVTPWRVRLDMASSDNVQILVSRHGRVVASDVLLPQSAVAGVKLDHEKLAAAHVLMVLLNALDDFSGMGGARSWLSVGLGYDATTGDHSGEDRIKLLSHAVSIDPHNWAAQTAYRVMLDSASHKRSTLLALVCWLSEAADEQKPDDVALKLRMLYAAYAARLNWNVGRVPADRDQSPTAEEIKKRFKETLGGASLDGLFETRIKAAAEAMFDKNSFEDSGLSLDPQTAYARACHAAQSQAPGAQEKAVALLRFSGPRYQSKAATDVSLKSLMTTRIYLDEFGAVPRSNLTELVPYSAAKDRLTSAGLLLPEALTSLTPKELADAAGISRAAATAWQLRAQIPLAVPSSLHTFRLEIADSLAAHGVVSPDGLNALRANAVRRAAASGDVITSLKRMKAYKGSHASAVEVWLRPR